MLFVNVYLDLSVRACLCSVFFIVSVFVNACILF